MNKDAIIKLLNLKKHLEGGYFSETYSSPLLSSEGRNIMTSIYYMLTNNEPVNYFHLNKFDIIHYYHLGSPITYRMINNEGFLEKFTLGPDVTKGHMPQLLIKGNNWKSAVLEHGEFCLISEVMAPGFDLLNNEIATQTRLKNLFPKLYKQIVPYIKPNNDNPSLY